MVLAVIPARYASTRFPGKPLVDIQGTSMIMRVYKQCLLAKKVNEVVVATDDQRILDHVQQAGGKAVMTRADHQSGTDRCAEVALQFPNARYVLNVQGDEPFIQPEQIDLLVETLVNSAHPIATLGKAIEAEEQLFNPNVVKLVRAQDGTALYFSRNPIPYLRGTDQEAWLTQGVHIKHIGLYGFQSEILHILANLAPAPLEQHESLEQLRWLSNGYRIQVGITELETYGVDVPEDLERFS
ncbi:MAG: 3-deoxy-manno-octulosonate cytidylyltransferase [Saprospiraceae bacterium]